MFISDLTKDSKVLDMNEVINLDPSEIKVEETSERIVHKIQDWLLKEVSLKEVAGLAEDTTQCLLVSVHITNPVTFNSNVAFPYSSVQLRYSYFITGMQSTRTSYTY